MSETNLNAHERAIRLLEPFKSGKRRRDELDYADIAAVIREAEMVLEDRLKTLQVAVKKFLSDINYIPPWESAGAAWADKLEQLHKAFLDSGWKEGE